MVGWDLTGGEAVLIPSTPKRSRPVSKDELRRPPTHDWSIYPKQRLLLFYIDRRYESDLDDITTIFNFAFSEILTEGRLPKGKLSAQIYESATWQISYVEDLLSLPDEFLPRKFNKIDEIVTESAQALGLTLARRTGPSRVETSKRSLKRKERALTTGIDSDSSVDVSIYDSDTKTESISRAIKRTARSFHMTSPKGSRTKTSTLENVAGLLTPPQTALSRKRKAESGPNACHDRNLLPAIAFSTPEISSITSTHTHDASRAVRHKSSRSAGIPSHGKSGRNIVARSNELTHYTQMVCRTCSSDAGTLHHTAQTLRQGLSAASGLGQHLCLTQTRISSDMRRHICGMIVSLHNLLLS